MNNVHVLDKQAWVKMTLLEQMGNIGSEVGRALNAKHRGDALNMKGAFYRGLDLIDFTATLWSAQKSPRTTELLRARELFAPSVMTDDEDITLEKYFMEYAIAARLNR
jgi:hypothetical protein